MKYVLFALVALTLNASPASAAEYSNKISQAVKGKISCMVDYLDFSSAEGPVGQSKTFEQEIYATDAFGESAAGATFDISPKNSGSKFNVRAIGFVQAQDPVAFLQKTGITIQIEGSSVSAGGLDNGSYAKASLNDGARSVFAECFFAINYDQAAVNQDLRD